MAIGTAIRYKLSFRNLFFYEPAGASVGRSASSRKNKFLNLKAFHCYLGQKRLAVNLVIRLFEFQINK
jgi:hypothetical protein